MDGPPQYLLRSALKRKSIYQKTVPLAPGHLSAERGLRKTWSAAT